MKEKGPFISPENIGRSLTEILNDASRTATLALKRARGLIDNERGSGDPSFFFVEGAAGVGAAVVASFLSRGESDAVLGASMTWGFAGFGVGMFLAGFMVHLKQAR